MPATAKLYETDPYVQTFTATVLVCTPAGEQFAVQLDRTAFYPEGGGQPCDTGALGTALVTDVQEHGGMITHTVSAALPVGQTVEGRIDWARRRDHMEQHTGEHILSGTLHRLFGAENVGFHIGSPAVRMDMSVPLTAGQLAEAEAQANAVIRADAPVRCWYPAPEDLAKLTYRSKKEIDGAVRLVDAGGADLCACCGTHVLRSGQVGLVKFLSVQKFREGVRIELLCGKRALEYLSRTWEQAKAIGQRLSVKPVDSEAAVERLEGELASLKLRCAQLEESVFESMAKEQAGKGNVLLFQPAMRPDSVRRLMDAVSKTCCGLAAVFAGEEGHYAYALGRADGQDISPLVKAMNTALHGRGGGRNGFAQGSVETERSAIESFFKENGYGICD